jgi:hypothetical protein
MTDNIVLAGVGTFNLAFKDKTGSERRKTGTAPGLPVIMSIKSTDFTDAKTKVKGTRTVVRFDEYIVIDAAGTVAPVSGYMVVSIPTGSVDLTSATLRQSQSMGYLLNSGIATGDQLGLASAIFVTKEQ